MADDALPPVEVDLDPVGLVRTGYGEAKEHALLLPYVNDRPYVASSFFSAAISRVFGTAMAGNSKERPELAKTPIALELRIAVSLSVAQGVVQSG